MAESEIPRQSLIAGGLTATRDAPAAAACMPSDGNQASALDTGGLGGWRGKLEPQAGTHALGAKQQRGKRTQMPAEPLSD